MMLLNNTSRYHVAAAAVRGAAPTNPRVEVDAHVVTANLMHVAQKDKEYIYNNGAGAWFMDSVNVQITDGCYVDPEGTFDVPTFEKK